MREDIRRRHDARADQRRAVATDDLHVDVVVAGIDQRDDRSAGLGEEWCGEGRQRGDADDRLFGGKTQPARCRDADAQAGKTARADRDGDAVERCERQLRRLHHAIDHRHQRFGMTTRHRLRFMGAERIRLGVEQGHGAGFERRVDGKDQHVPIIAISRADFRRATRGTIHNVVGRCRSAKITRPSAALRPRRARNA